MWANLSDEDRVVAMTALRYWRGAAHRKLEGLDPSAVNGNGDEIRVTRTMVGGRIMKAGDLLNRLERGEDE